MSDGVEVGVDIESYKTIRIDGQPERYVKLNVGGFLFCTTIGTLSRYDSMLRTMFSGKMDVLIDAEGWVMIDRNGKHFGTILDFLRDETAPLPADRLTLQYLLVEAEFYLIKPLVEFISGIITEDENPGIVPEHLMPIVDTVEEENRLVNASVKPVIKFICNRHNNKYSYTPNSDENMLRNLELFDRLFMSYHKRISFLKVVKPGDLQEICGWSFFGHAQKVADVSCTSIVYGTDKKHTKIEFPEARILEEALNVLRYENVCFNCGGVVRCVDHHVEESAGATGIKNVDFINKLDKMNKKK